MPVSVIVPALNEGARIDTMLQALQPLRRRGNEIIVVDGGSADDTVGRATPYCDQLMSSRRGRAAQMNAGAGMGSGDYLLFLHADTLMAEATQRNLADVLNDARPPWGFCKVRLDARGPAFRLVETMMNWRSRTSRIATGDQGMFVRRDVFDAVGGFPEIDLMEDIAMSKRLRRSGNPVVVDPPLVTSARRWQHDGIVRTVVLMWFLRASFFFGASPRRLHAIYYGSSKV